MNSPDPVLVQNGTSDEELGLIIEQLTARLQAGTPVDLSSFILEHPEQAEKLKQLLPALQVLADLGRSAPSAIAATPVEDTSDELIGTLGDYRIIREVGRGGMGVVYEAEQISLNRRVALKVLPFAATLDGRQLQRFRNEANAAAHLHHQHIVPVYQISSVRAVHFYAMQFIEGQPLSAMIDDLRQIAALDNKVAANGTAAALDSTKRLEKGQESPIPSKPPDLCDGGFKVDPYKTEMPTPSTTIALAKEPTERGHHPSSDDSTQTPAFFRTVARLGMQAAAALEHAHSLGVIHRDIKPGNMLIDLHGDLWITDFGLAQIQGDVKLTMTGDLIGTIRYMSPEQALAKRVIVDQRTDIYSLGATLYELMTLEPAFTGRDRQEILRQIAFEEPRLPKKINRAIPVDLQTIVLKALAKNPADRYGAAKELGDDLQRFLNDESIRAQPPTLRQKVQKWARRHQSLVWSVGGAAVAVGLVVVVALLQANFRIKQEKNEALRQQQLAETNFQMARRAVDTYLTQVSEEQLLNEPGMQPLRERLLNSALQYYQEFAEQRADDPAQRKELAEAYRRMGDIIALRSSKADAEAPLAKAIELFEKLHDADPADMTVVSGLAKSYQALSYVRVFGQQKGTGMEPAQRAITLLENFRTNNQKINDYGRVLGRSYDLLGLSNFYTSHYPEAIEAGGKAIAVLKDTILSSPGDTETKRMLATVYVNQSLSMGKMESQKDQERALAASKDLLDELVAKYPQVRRFQADLAKTYGALGRMYMDLGRLNKAEPSYHRSKDWNEPLVKENPTVTIYKRYLSIALGNLGEIRIGQGRTVKTKEMLLRASDLYYDPWFYYRLGGLEAATGDLTSALLWTEKARESFANDVRDNPHDLEQLSNLQWSRQQKGLLRVANNQTTAAGQIAEQLQIVQEREKIRDQGDKTNFQWPFELADAHVRLSELQLQAGMAPAALSRVEQGLVILEKVTRAHEANYEFRRFYGYAYGVQARIQSELGDAAGALRSARQAVAIVEKLVPEETAYLYDLACHRALCSSLVGLGKKELTPEETAESQKLAAASVEAMRQAIAAGYDNTYKLKSDPCLTPVRSREDFKKLLEASQEKLSKEAKWER